MSENKKYFTKEQVKGLEPFEPYLHSAVYSDYNRAIGKNAIDFMKSIYEATTGVEYGRICLNCAEAVLKFLKRVGNLFYESKAYLDTLPVEETPKKPATTGKRGLKHGTHLN